jgi:hypothetical protein
MGKKEVPGAKELLKGLGKVIQEFQKANPEANIRIGRFGILVMVSAEEMLSDVETIREAL